MQYTKLRLDRPQLEKAEQDEIRRSAAEEEVVKNLKMFSTMGQIIFCDDLILRVDDKEDLTNVTEWLLESTEYRPASPESCTVRNEVTPHGKIAVILVVWLGLIVVTFLYFYFCEWRLFPRKNRLKERFCDCAEAGNLNAEKSRSNISSGVACNDRCCNTDVMNDVKRSSTRLSTSTSSFSSSMRSRFTSSSSGYSSGQNFPQGSIL